MSKMPPKEKKEGGKKKKTGIVLGLQRNSHRDYKYYSLNTAGEI